jgi:hypothetical protein
MISLEEFLLSLRAKDSVVLLGETYKVKNIISATDGKILKAHLILIKPDVADFCITIDLSTSVYDSLNKLK